jgi:hypothetical protein
MYWRLYRLESHQIQGGGNAADYKNIYPVIQWLVKKVGLITLHTPCFQCIQSRPHFSVLVCLVFMCSHFAQVIETRAETGDLLRMFSEFQFGKEHVLPEEQVIEEKKAVCASYTRGVLCWPESRMRAKNLLPSKCQFSFSLCLFSLPLLLCRRLLTATNPLASLNDLVAASLIWTVAQRKTQCSPSYLNTENITERVCAPTHHTISDRVVCEFVYQQMTTKLKHTRARVQYSVPLLT